MNDRERIQLHRKQLRQEFGSLFDEVAAILFDVDPININFGCPTDEYEPEVGTILPRLQSCYSVEDTRRVVHQEFVRWFAEDMAGAEKYYQQAAERIWAAWQVYQQS